MNAVRSSRFFVGVLFCVGLLAAPGSSWAVEVNGRLGGTITEAQTGTPIPGAAVTISSKSLIGGPRKVSTDESGRYLFTELPPGSYTVEVGYQDVKPIKRQVVVRQGELLPLDVAWSVELAQTEVTVVKEERHLTKPDTTQSGTVITADQTSKVPTGRSYQGVALQVAGAVDVDGGGNPQVKGSNRIGNHYLVDGLDISDPVTGTFSANMNFDSISSVDVITGGMEAQYNSMGGIINVITEGGSDEWHLDSSVYVNNDRLSAKGQFGANPLNGLSPLSPIPPAPTQSYQANLNLGGPILKHRLWFHSSVEYRYTESSIPAGPPLNVQAPTRRSNGVNARLKLTWAPSDRHRLTWAISADPASFDNVGTPLNARLPAAQTHQNQGGFFTTALWNFFINPNVTTTVGGGFSNTFIDSGPQGYFGKIDNLASSSMFSDKNKAYNFNQPQHINQVDGSVWYQGRASIDQSRRYRFQFDPSVSIRGNLAGSHDIKIGVQTSYKLTNRNFFYNGGGVSYVDAGGGPLEAGLCDEAVGTGCFLKNVNENWKNKFHAMGGGFFAQDRWRPFSRLMILPGIRLDYGVVSNSAGQTASRLFGVGPRIGMVIDPWGDKKTTVYGFYGRSNEVDNMLVGSNTSVQGKSQTFAWNPMTKAFDQLVSASGGPGGSLIDPRAKTPPHTDEISVGLRREFFTNSLASVEYTYKRVANLWDAIEINTVWDPTGTRQVTDAMGNPIYVDPTQPQQINLITTNHNGVRYYHGVDFVVESRPTPNWDLYAAYTVSWLYGSMSDQFQGQIFAGQPGPFYNPRQTFLYNGFLPEDLRHVLKIRPSYSFNRLTLGALMTYSTGVSLSRYVFQYVPDGAYLNLRSPIGTEANPKRANDPRAFSEFRLPDTLGLSLRVAYDLGSLFRDGQHLHLLADVFNALNLRTPTGVITTDRDTYGSVSARQQPLRVQLALRYMF